MGYLDECKEHDRRQEGTAYWDYLTDPRNAVKEKLIQLLKQYPIDYPGKEFIMQPKDAFDLAADLENLGIAIIGVTVWCFIPAGMKQKKYCCDGLGGPSREVEGGVEWFSEYVHLGSCVPDWALLPRDTALAHKCDPQARDYIKDKLPHEPGYSEYFRVSLDLYIPVMWDLFPE